MAPPPATRPRHPQIFLSQVRHLYVTGSTAVLTDYQRSIFCMVCLLLSIVLFRVGYKTLEMYRMLRKAPNTATVEVYGIQFGRCNYQLREREWVCSVDFDKPWTVLGDGDQYGLTGRVHLEVQARLR